MNSYLICLLLLIFPLSAKPAEGMSEWIPRGWKTIKSASGDLNKDGLSDIALIIEERNPEKLIKNNFLGPDILNTNLRRLIILLKNSSGYSLALSRDDLIQSEHQEDFPCLMDPIQEGGIEISKGLLIIRFKNWMSCGSWSVDNSIFIFRQEANRFRLIGYESSDYARNTGIKNEKSINYLTRKKKSTFNMNIFDASLHRPKVQWNILDNSRKYYLNNIVLDCGFTGATTDWCM